jgi:hypothetical protein
MNRALRICRNVGCTALVASGYCAEHQNRGEEIIRNRFKKIESKKTPEQRKFYSSLRWTECSRIHRIHEPLCRKCKTMGRIIPATLTHHNPSREVLIHNGLSPFDDKFLESSCFNCHQKELTTKQQER